MFAAQGRNIGLSRGAPSQSEEAQEFTRGNRPELTKISGRT